MFEKTEQGCFVCEFCKAKVYTERCACPQGSIRLFIKEKRLNESEQKGITLPGHKEEPVKEGLALTQRLKERLGPIGEWLSIVGPVLALFVWVHHENTHLNDRL